MDIKMIFAGYRITGDGLRCSVWEALALL